MPTAIHPHDLYVGAGNTVTVHGDNLMVADQNDDQVEVIHRGADGVRLFFWVPKAWITAVNGDPVEVNGAPEDA